MTWATTADVLAITGASATSTNLAIAESIIEVYANRTAVASAGMSPRDLGWMKQASAWQARYVTNHPGVGDQTSVQQISQDGVQITYAKEWEITLAPLAARALKNLSWKSDRTQRVPRLGVPVGMATAVFLAESGDQYQTWER